MSFRLPLLKMLKHFTRVQAIGYCAVVNIVLKSVVISIIHWAGNNLYTPGATPSKPQALSALILVICALTSAGEIGSSSTGIVTAASWHSLTRSTVGTKIQWRAIYCRYMSTVYYSTPSKIKRLSQPFIQPNTHSATLLSPIHDGEAVLRDVRFVYGGIERQIPGNTRTWLSLML